MRVQITRVFAGVLVLLAACTSAKPNVEGEVDLGPPPVAATQAAPAAAPLGTLVLLDGSASSDPAGLPLQFDWRLTSVPAGSTATLSTPDNAQPNFVVDLPGTYVARLVVSNGKRWSHPSTFTVKVEPVKPDPRNQPPVARIVAVPEADFNVVTRVDGSGSSDPEGAQVAYAWSMIKRPAGSRAVLSEPTSAAPEFVPDQGGDFTIQLIVHDGQRPSTSATATIFVDHDLPPDLSSVTFMFNPQHTNSIAGGTLQAPMRRRWIAKVDGFIQYPLVTKDSVFFIGRGRGTSLYAFNIATGEKKWTEVTLETGFSFASYHLAFDSGSLFVTSSAGRIMAVDSSDGSIKWDRPAEADAKYGNFQWAPVALDGKIFATGSEGASGDLLAKGFVFNQIDGNLVTKTDIIGFGESSPAILGSNIYIGNGSGLTWAFEGNNGAQIWKTEAKPDCSQDVNLCAGIPDVMVGDRFLVAATALLDLDGEILRMFAYNRPRAIHNRIGVVYDKDSQAYGAVNVMDGTEYWTGPWLLPGSWYENESGPPVIINGMVVYTSGDGTITAVDRKTGVRLWSDFVWKNPDDPAGEFVPSGLASNGEVLVVPRRSKLVVYETAPDGSEDDSYKFKCTNPGDQFYVEGTKSADGPNGVDLENGSWDFEGESFVSETNQLSVFGSARSQVTVIAKTPTQVQDWTLELSPLDGTPLTVGTYSGMSYVLHSSHDTGNARFGLWKERANYCEASRFVVNVTDIIVQSGQTVGLAGSFVRHCNDSMATVRGCLKIGIPTP